MNKIIVIIIAFFTISVSGQNNQQVNKSLDSIQSLDEVIIKTSTILGSKFAAKNRTGAAYYISSKELTKLGFNDVNKVLKTVPGVTIYEEDGFGLRPNISLRGTSPERSSKITLMEDGVLIAPAPYSAAAAYYFPTIARMEAVEILKGSSQIQYGPSTTGGAINFISSQIPESFEGSLRTRYGSFQSSQLHAKIGNSSENISYLFEYLNYGSDGFKSLPSNQHTGFDKNDILAKIRVNLFPKMRMKQSLELKIQYSDEISNETYLGITETDFNAAPFQRYAASDRDKMTTEHQQFMLTHELDFSKNFRITTTAYQNNFKRNWYKLNNVIVNNQKLGIGSILNNPSQYPNYFNIIKGIENSTANALLLKANNRDYLSKGIQSKFDYHWYQGDFFHDIEVGVRYHYDDEDRFQWVDGYQMVNKTLVQTSKGVAGTDANRISSANAFASFINYKVKYQHWTFTPGIRYENISLKRTDYGTNDVTRSGINIALRENNVNAFIPGIGVNYKFNNDYSIFGGIHKGFSPPGNQEGQSPEESVNIELGTRVSFGRIKAEVVGFQNNYDNLLGSDVAATGGTGTLNQFNAGEVSVNGIEFLLNYNFTDETSKVAVPFTFGYTYTNTKFETNFDSAAGLWGEVSIGDELPYIPKHQFNSSLALEHKKFDTNLNINYTGAFRTQAGAGSIPSNEKVAANWVLNFSGAYHVNERLDITLNSINLLNTTYAVSRVSSWIETWASFRYLWRNSINFLKSNNYNIIFYLKMTLKYRKLVVLIVLYYWHLTQNN